MNNLKVFFVVMAIHRDKEWVGQAGYIFAEDTITALNLLAGKYSEVNVRVMEEVPVKAGTMLFGERWRTTNT